MKYLKIVIPLLLICLTGCMGEEWSAIVYPDKNNPGDSDNIGVFDSLESCRVASINKLSSLGNVRNGDYECGLDCKLNGYGFQVCKQTAH